MTRAVVRQQKRTALGEAYAAVDWSRAACRGTDVVWFFDELWLDEPGTTAMRAAIQECRDICYDCPIRAACLRYAIAAGEWGFWGGTTHKERLERRATLLRRLNGGLSLRRVPQAGGR